MKKGQGVKFMWKKKLYRLIETRKLMALFVIVLFGVLAINGTLETNFIQTVIITVISFYFGKSTALDDPQHYEYDGDDNDK